MLHCLTRGGAARSTGQPPCQLTQLQATGEDSFGLAQLMLVMGPLARRQGRRGARTGAEPQVQDGP